MFQDVSTTFKSPLRVKVVTFFVRQPELWSTTDTVATTLGTPRASVARELGQLVRFGLLKSRRVGSQVQYKINEHDDLFSPLTKFIPEVTNLTDREIVTTFKGVRGLVLIVAAGLLANEQHSPVDLLIIGKNPDEKRIDKIVKKLEVMAAVPLRYSVMDEDEYYDRKQSYDRFLRDIFEYRHRMVLEKRN